LAVSSSLLPIAKNIYTILADLEYAAKIIYLVWKLCITISKIVKNTYTNLCLWKDLELSWNWKIHFHMLQF